MLAPAAVARAIHIEPPRAVDLLADAVEHVRPHLNRSFSLHERVQAFWASIAAAGGGPH
jgi:hypothetical protein